MAEHQAVALIKGQTLPSASLRQFMDASIVRALLSTGMTDDAVAAYLKEKAPLMDSLSSEDMATRLLLELDPSYFVHC